MASASGLRPSVSFGSPPRLRLVPILDAYILREMLAPFAFGFGAFLLFWFVNIFFAAADYLINKGAPPFLVLRFLILRVPQSTPLAFPFACLFGTLLAFGRLTTDNEITALRTSGVSFPRIALMPVIFGLAMFGASYAIDERLVPQATDLSTRTFYQIVYRTATLPIEPQIYRKDPSTGKTFYIGNVLPDGKTMSTVAIYEPGRTTPFLTVTTAETAVVDVEHSMLLLHNAVQTRFKPDGSVDSILRGVDLNVGLPIGETAQTFLSSAYNDPYTMDSKTLARDVKARQASGQGGSDLALRKITLAQKLSNPFAAFIGVLVALPLAVRFGRKGRTLGIALSIMVLAVYDVLNAMSAAFGRNGSLDPYLAAWIPNAVFALVGAVLIFSEGR